MNIILSDNAEEHDLSDFYRIDENEIVSEETGRVYNISDPANIKPAGRAAALSKIRDLERQGKHYPGSIYRDKGKLVFIKS